MNPYSIIGALILLAASFGYAVWERGDAMKARADLATLKADYASKAAAAVTHAQAVEAAQQKQLDSKTKDALSQASSATSKANAVRGVYLKKLGELAATKPKDLPHLCAGVEIPADLRP